MRQSSAFLWSILNIAGGGIKQHIVVQTPPAYADNPRLVLEQAFASGADPHYEHRKLIRFSNEAPYLKRDDSITFVPMSTVFGARDEAFPSFHSYSRSHFVRFSQSIYQSVMDYADFCKMEDKLAHIVNNYLDDEKNNWMVLMDDPFLMGSVRGYGTKSSVVGRTTWATTEKTEFTDILLAEIQEDQNYV